MGTDHSQWTCMAYFPSPGLQKEHFGCAIAGIKGLELLRPLGHSEVSMAPTSPTWVLPTHPLQVLCFSSAVPLPAELRYNPGVLQPTCPWTHPDHNHSADLLAWPWLCFGTLYHGMGPTLPAVRSPSLRGQLAHTLHDRQGEMAPTFGLDNR